MRKSTVAILVAFAASAGFLAGRWRETPSRTPDGTAPVEHFSVIHYPSHGVTREYDLTPYRAAVDGGDGGELWVPRDNPTPLGGPDWLITVGRITYRCYETPR